MKHIIPFIVFSFFISNISAQYVTIDKDGYTNVRREPNTKSPILGKILSDQIFYNMMDDCEMNGKDFEGNDIIKTDNWMPVYIRQFSGVGYVYKPNIKEIYDYAQLLPKKIDSTTVSFEDRNIKIEITVQNINKSRYMQRLGQYRYYIITGEQGFPYFISDGSYVIQKMLITWNNKTEKVNEILFHKYFFYDNPFKLLETSQKGEILGLKVFNGENGTYFLSQHGGDGGESYRIIYVIKDGIVLYMSFTDGCSVAALNIMVNEEIE